MPQLHPEAVPPQTSPATAPRAAKRGGWREWIGPGVLTGASDDDPSGIGTYSQAGAAFGLGLLWVMVFTFPLMAVVQIISAQVGRVTGRGLAANLAKITPRWLLIPLMVLLFVANAVNIGADLAAMGEVATLLLPGHPAWYAFAFGAASVVLQVLLPYTRHVKYLKWLTISLLAYVATVLVVDVPWREVAIATFIPHMPANAEAAAMLVAVLGTTISPYLFFWQASQEAEEQRAAPDEQPLRVAPEQAERQLKRVEVDTVIGMAASNAVGFFIMLTAAVTLHAHGSGEIQTAAQAAEALRPIAGPWAFALFALGIVGTGLLAVPVLAGSAGYALAESLAWKRGLERPFHAARGFYAVITVATVAGIAMPLLHVNPIHALVVSAVLNGVIAVPVLAAMMIAASSGQVMGEFRITGMLRTFGWITVAVMALAALSLALSP